MKQKCKNCGFIDDTFSSQYVRNFVCADCHREWINDYPKLEKKLKERNQEIAILERALEMACAWINNSSWQVVDGTESEWEKARNFNLFNYYIEQAKKEKEGK